MNLRVGISGMSCSACAAAIERELVKIDGISSANVNFASELANIDYGGSELSLAVIQEALDSAGGYNVVSESLSLSITGISCAGCVRAIEGALSAKSGIVSAGVNFASNIAKVQFIPGIIDRVSIIGTIREAGYDVLSDDVDNIEDHNSDLRLLKLKLFIAVCLSIPIMVLSMGNDLLNISRSTVQWVVFILAIPVQFFVGSQFVMGALKTARHFRANMDTLVAMGTLSAFTYSTFVTFGVLDGYIYFEASAVVITLILVGKYLEAIAKGKTSMAIKGLIGLQPKNARVIRDGVEVDLPIMDVRLGDVVIVRPGERLPIDGIVESGESYVDQSMLTGEPVPIFMKEGSKVVGGTINQRGSLMVLCERVGKDTVLSHMIRLVEEAQGSKAPIQRLVDKVAGIFVPIVLVISLFTFVTWLLLLFWGIIPLGIGDTILSKALISTVAVLVIACPCALGLATPTAIMVGVGKGASNGILIKSAEAIERVRGINSVVFDKTGTLTCGRPEVNDVIVIDDRWTRDDIVMVAASVEKRSEHPLGDAIVKYAADLDIVTRGVSSFDSVTGKGVKAILDGKEVLVGNRRFMDDFNISVIDMASIVDGLEDEAKTVIFVSVGGGLIGIIGISDKLKDSAYGAIRALHDMDIRTIMVTGDNAHTARAIGDKLNIKEIISDVLPGDKMSMIKKLQSDNRMVIMVGDGINDAPALAQADISIAIGSGTDIAMETAQITLMKDDLVGVPQAINLSKQTMRTIKVNLFWAFIYNIIAIPFAVMGFLSPMIAGGAMAFSSISVVFNSLFLRRYKLL